MYLQLTHRLSLLLSLTKLLLLTLTKGVEGRDGNLMLGCSIPWIKGWPVGGEIASAVIIAIEEIHRRQLLRGYEIEWIWRDSYCEPQHGMAMAVDMWASMDHLDAIIGDGCSVVCQPISLLAASWNIPTISFGCSSATLSDKSTYPTFSRTEGTVSSLGPVYDQMASMFNWNRIGMITTTEDIWKSQAEAARMEMEKQGKMVIFRVISTTVQGDKTDKKRMRDLQDTLVALKGEARIFFTFSYKADLENILLAAMEENMLRGEYLFITFEFHHDIATEYPYTSQAHHTISEGLVGISFKQPSGQAFNDFLQKVIDEFQDPLFDNVPHVPADAKVEDISIYSGNLHDAVLQWAYGVNKTLEQGYPPDDGLHITENIFNMTFQGITGSVTIDERGDRQPDQTVGIIQKGRVVPLMDWISSEGRMLKVYKPQDMTDWTGLTWYGNGNKVPSDTPICGWDNKLCNAEDNSHTLIMTLFIIGITLVIIVIIVVLILLRRYRYEQALKEIEGARVNWQDVMEIRSTRRKVNGLYGVVMYKDRPVMTYPLAVQTTDMQHRHVLVEIKVMKELNFENINRFVGLCSESPNIYVLMEYPSRGSLYATLQNDYKLDWDFRVSIIRDIANGLWYLHQSPIQGHGRLTSHDCLLDSRWMCKVSGYGFRGHQGLARQPQPEYDLWKAPELLQSQTDVPNTNFKHCDTYSFAIIAQEVVLQALPFTYTTSDLSLSVIMDKVRQGLTPPFRPFIPHEACDEEWRNIITSCWQETANARPSFRQILNTLYEIQKGEHISLVDSMINRLEVYTQTLEEMVVDRVRKLGEEKSRVETILSELLPKSIAEQLALGQRVQPEAFDCVTIFFSDIVGFTHISAQSTPLEIVNMLNSMYTLFDDIAHQFDVYKVATIGDAYMVASGVPIRNGDKHAAEICGMGLALLKAITDFPIHHLPSESLHLRIGLHSGPCVAGVTGLKMPRYLLFGDTVDIANRMESSGHAMRIHVSETTHCLAKNGSAFIFEQRGKLDIKGYGSITTYWVDLTDKD